MLATARNCVYNESIKKRSEVNMESKVGGCLAMVMNVDFDKEEILISDFVFNKKMVIQGSKEVLEMIGNALNYALDRNLFIFVEYDEKIGIILE